MDCLLGNINVKILEGGNVVLCWENGLFLRRHRLKNFQVKYHEFCRDFQKVQHFLEVLLTTWSIKGQQLGRGFCPSALRTPCLPAGLYHHGGCLCLDR